MNLSSFTISFWVNIGKGNPANARLIDKQDAGPANSWTFSYSTSANTVINFYIRSGTDLRGTLTTPKLLNDTWYMITASLDNSTWLSYLYLNGTLVDTNTTSYQALSAANLTICKRFNGANFFNGTVDEIAIWNRTLSATDISNLYNMSINLPTNAWSNITKMINSTVGSNIRWCVYANDTSGNWNGTSCTNPFNYLTTSPPANTCTYGGSGNWNVACSDNCIISGAVNLGGNKLAFSGSGTFTVNAAIVNISQVPISSGCTIYIGAGQRFLT
jgi:hypothetical protein